MLMRGERAEKRGRGQELGPWEDRKDAERKRKGVFQVRTAREQRKTWGNADVIFK